MIWGNGSAAGLGAGGVDGWGVAAATAEAALDESAGRVPFVFGGSGIADAMSSSREVAASSLRRIDVSSSRWNKYWCLGAVHIEHLSYL